VYTVKTAAYSHFYASRNLDGQRKILHFAIATRFYLAEFLIVMLDCLQHIDLQCIVGVVQENNKYRLPYDQCRTKVGIGQASYTCLTTN